MNNKLIKNDMKEDNINIINFNNFEEHILTLKCLISKSFLTSLLRAESLGNSEDEEELKAMTTTLFKEIRANEFAYSTLMNATNRMRDFVYSKFKGVDGSMNLFLRIKPEFYRKEFESTSINDMQIVYFDFDKIALFQDQIDSIVTINLSDRLEYKSFNTVEKFEDLSGTIMMEIYEIEKYIDHICRNKIEITIEDNNKPCYLNRLLTELNINAKNLDAHSLHIADLIGCIHSNYYMNKELFQSISRHRFKQDGIELKL